ncbi:hypothetical protein B0T26DRAFT_763964 [Lasiosphaeria miniovina]|uniref:DUF7703 domain-containing protein n=1 Tax=Lasiosphaeria miniovina TaxID=1954250 RepID=A0AA40B334_9PEZI|nr:uncharacterized protein B0T26DRAFT_763964 [Lasiosphaeria miniovina]KAK0726766.1 hypothetical protein B0T26DRAFT_763964 [Lasiosphaeria miniovina]
MVDLKDDLRTSMIIAAFVGISWYIGAEINTSLFILFKRRRGLYFWSCALCSWGVVLQPLCIILADFGIWTDLKAAITFIYLTWLIMVVPQSWLLYSRLHLLLHHDRVLRWIKAVLLVNSVVFSVPTIVVGILAQTTTTNPNLFHINLIWDRIQLTVFFVQETALSLLYIYHTRQYLRDSSLLSQPPPSSVLPLRPVVETDEVLRHLVYTNVLVIALDVALLGVQYADLFYLQGAFKPCVYGIKLKVEFAILNRLVEMVRRRGGGGGGGGGNMSYPGGGQQLQLPSQQHRQPSASSSLRLSRDDHNSKSVASDHIGLRALGGGVTDGNVNAVRSQSQESQAPIWHGQSRADAEAWPRVYHVGTAS